MQGAPPSRFRKAAKSLAHFLETDASLGQLSAHAGRLLRLQYIYENAVPPTLARQGRVANLKLGKVVIHARNGAVAAKIRQLTPRLADVFRQAGVDVNEIQVKVQPDGDPHLAQRQVKPALLGEGAQRGLSALKGRLPPDSPLRGALDRFLERAQITKR